MRAAILLALLLTGCSTRLTTTDAILRAATSEEIARDADQALPSHVKGWMMLTATLDRISVSRIASAELFVTQFVGDCGPRPKAIAMSPTLVDGVRANDFQALKALLAANPARQRFTLTALTYGIPSEFTGPQCMELRGGGYLVGKLKHDQVPVRVII